MGKPPVESDLDPALTGSPSRSLVLSTGGGRRRAACQISVFSPQSALAGTPLPERYFTARYSGVPRYFPRYFTDYDRCRAEGETEEEDGCEEIPQRHLRPPFGEFVECRPEHTPGDGAQSSKQGVKQILRKERRMAADLVTLEPSPSNRGLGWSCETAGGCGRRRARPPSERAAAVPSGLPSDPRAFGKPVAGRSSAQYGRDRPLVEGQNGVRLERDLGPGLDVQYLEISQRQYRSLAEDDYR